MFLKVNSYEGATKLGSVVRKVRRVVRRLTKEGSIPMDGWTYLISTSWPAAGRAI